jgi:hypothetical protein
MARLSSNGSLASARRHGNVRKEGQRHMVRELAKVGQVMYDASGQSTPSRAFRGCGHES